MNRRRFLRVLGGGTIAAASLPLAGCSGSMPEEAIAGWHSPEATGDVRRWILAHAILAPHSHNLQSWVVDLRAPGEIALYCDLNRLLPETDPFGRQIMMSHGTFLEILDLAARERGLRADVTLFPEGEFTMDRIDARPVARVRLAADSTAAPDPLFAQIFHRHTNRSLYAPERTVPDAARAAMQAAAGPGVDFGCTAPADGEALRAHRAIAQDAWRIELTTPRTMLESYKVLRIGATEIAKHRDGLSLTDPTVVWLTRLGLFDRSKAPGPNDRAVTSQIDDFREKLASTPAFLWMTTADNQRRTQIAAGRAYVRVQLAATAHGIAMQPLQQALQEYPEQAGPHAAIRKTLGVTTPPRTVQMWARLGYAPPVGPAPRRDLDAFVRA